MGVASTLVMDSIIALGVVRGLQPWQHVVNLSQRFWHGTGMNQLPHCLQTLPEAELLWAAMASSLLLSLAYNIFEGRVKLTCSLFCYATTMSVENVAPLASLVSWQWVFHCVRSIWVSIWRHCPTGHGLVLTWWSEDSVERDAEL